MSRIQFIAPVVSVAWRRSMAYRATAVNSRCVCVQCVACASTAWLHRGCIGGVVRKRMQQCITTDD